MYYTAIVCTWEYSTLETPTPKSTPQQIHLTIILSLRNNLATFPYGVFSEFHAWCDLQVHSLEWGGGWVFVVFVVLCGWVGTGAWKMGGVLKKGEEGGEGNGEGNGEGRREPVGMVLT